MPDDHGGDDSVSLTEFDRLLRPDGRTREVEIDNGDLQTRYVELGEMAIRHARVPAGADMAPLLRGLPHDRCPSPHWGIVLSGSIHMVHADGTAEIVRAGEVYHWPAGHTGTTDEPVEFLEIGPVAQMRRFNEHVRSMFSTA